MLADSLSSDSGCSSRGSTTWLGLPTVYYRECDLACSTNIWDLFDPAEVEFDLEGLEGYVRFGFSVFGRTPLRGIRFCLPNERVETALDGSRRLVQDPDPAEDWIGYVGTPERVIEMTRSKVQAWEAGCDGSIVLPLSGGYDSRFLLSFLRDRDRVRTFTYGLSNKQEESFEVRYAAEIARRTGVRWRQIPLGQFHHMLDDWYALQGPSTHAHGMYQMEFFKQVRRLVGSGRPLLSGLVGGFWAKLSPPLVRTPDDIIKLGYTHGLCADHTYLKRCCSNEFFIQAFDERRKLLAEPILSICEVVRTKAILSSYLLRVPHHYGFHAWSPFLDVDCAREMACIQGEQRASGSWQLEYFAKAGLAIPPCVRGSNYSNTLNAQACRMAPPPPLNERLLGRLFQVDYIRWINQRVGSYCGWRSVLFAPLSWPVRGASRFHAVMGIRDDRLRAYCAYLTLYPLNALLEAQELARGAKP